MPTLKLALHLDYQPFYIRLDDNEIIVSGGPYEYSWPFTNVVAVTLSLYPIGAASRTRPQYISVDGRLALNIARGELIVEFARSCDIMPPLEPAPMMLFGTLVDVVPLLAAPPPPPKQRVQRPLHEDINRNHHAFMPSRRNYISIAAYYAPNGLCIHESTCTCAWSEQAKQTSRPRPEV